MTITAVNNDADEADKSVTVKGAPSNTKGIFNPPDLTLTLEDDDTVGVTLSETDLDINEGANGTYTVVLDTRPTASVTVTPIRSSGDTDVTVSGALTFTTSNWNSAQTVTVSAAQDNDANDDTAVIGHSIAGGDYASFAVGYVNIDVDDDETASSGVTLTVSPTEVAESASATNITVTARLNGGTRDAATPVAVNVGSGTATSGTDFATVGNFTITIPANSLSHTGTFSLDPTQDTIDEPEETVAVDGSTTVSGFSVTDTTVKITDDDAAPTVTLSLSRDTIRETNDANTPNVEEHKTTVTASLNHASSAQTTVTVSVDPNSPARSSDYSLSTNKVLTFAAGSTSSTGAVTITAVDNIRDTPDKTVSVKGLASNSIGITNPVKVTLTLEDDDGVTRVQGSPASTGAELTVIPVEVGEGAGATNIKVRAALNGLARATATNVSVSVGSGTAISGADFSAVSGFRITISAGSLSETATFSFTPTSDTVDESDETVIVSGSTTISSFTVTNTQFKITDDDATPTVTLSLSRDTIRETDNSSTANIEEHKTTVTASLNHASSVQTTVTISVDPNSPARSSDYGVSTNKVLTFAAGSTSSSGTVTITAVNNDVDVADKTATVKGAATNSLGVIDPFDVTLTLEDDDTRGVTLSETDLDINEGANGTYTVVLDTRPTASVTVTPSRSSGDTDVTVSRALTFTTSNWNTARTVTVSAGQDNDANDDAAVIGHSVTGGDYASFAAGSVSIDVDDDESASSGATLSISPTEVAESANATDITVTATLNGGTRDATTPVAVTVGSGTATSGTDFTAVNGFTITIPANTQSHSGTFSLDPTQDTIYEQDETVSVNGSSTLQGFTVSGTALKITDDETAPRVSLSLSRDTIRETDDAGTTNVEEHKTTVTASLDHGSSASTTVTISVESSLPATSSDYSLSTNKVLTIAAGSTSSTGTVTITAVNNDADEADKSVTVKGAPSNTKGIFNPPDLTLTLEDDDTVGVTLSETRSRHQRGG